MTPLEWMKDGRTGLVIAVTGCEGNYDSLEVYVGELFTVDPEIRMKATLERGVEEVGLEYFSVTTNPAGLFGFARVGGLSPASAVNLALTDYFQAVMGP